MSNKTSPFTTDWFPRACRAARGWLGWSANDLAERLDISPRQVQRIEGEHNQSDKRREEIGQVFAAEGIRIGPHGLEIIPASDQKRDLTDDCARDLG